MFCERSCPLTRLGLSPSLPSPRGERRSPAGPPHLLLPCGRANAQWTKPAIFHRFSPTDEDSFPRFQALGAVAKETFIHALSAACIIGPSPSREPGAHRVSGRAAVPGRSRGGNAAGNFHPRPGPVPRLPRTTELRGGPDDRARPPAGRWEGAIYLLYEVPTQRPASRLLPTGSVL